MIVDFGIFHLVCNSRSISDGYSLFWVLLWMSMSYGFTNFAWIWLWISKDKHLFEWSFLILMWWFVCPLLTKTFAPANVENIVIQRTTGEYHGYMAAILVVGYLGLIIYNLWQKEREKRVNIPWLLAIGCLSSSVGKRAFLSAAYVPQALLSPKNSLRLSSTLFLKQISECPIYS